MNCRLHTISIIFFISCCVLFPQPGQAVPQIGKKLLSLKNYATGKLTRKKALNPGAVQQAGKQLPAQLTTLLTQKTSQQRPQAQTGRLFQAVSCTDPRIKFSGVVFYTYYQGKKEIYGAMVAHAVPSARAGIPGIARRFEATFFLPGGESQKIPAEIVAFSPVNMLDLALIKFPAQAEPFLNPYPLGQLENEKEVFSLGYNDKGLLPVYNRQVLENLPYSIRTSMPVAESTVRQGLCGSAVLNSRQQLIGIHTGSSVTVNAATRQPVCSFATPARFLNLLVQAYHNGGKAQVPFYIDNKRFIKLNIDEYIVSYTLLDSIGVPLLTKEVDFHLSRASLKNQLQFFPQTKYLLITTHKLSWDKNGRSLPISLFYDDAPKTTYLYHLKSGKQYKIPRFIRPPRPLRFQQ